MFSYELYRLCRVTLLPVVLLVAPITFSQGISSSSVISDTSKSKYAANHVLVKFRATASAEDREAVHAALGSYTLRRYAAVRDLEVVLLPQNLELSKALRAYRQRPEVEYAEPDFIVHSFSTPNDPLFPQMWNLLNTGQNGGTPGDDVGASLAWNLSTGDHSIVVATLDTGIDYTHPDLIPNLFHNLAVCNGVNDDTNGCYGIAPVYNNSNPFDDNGHGTHVAGIIGAAGNNNLGVAGINWTVQVLACKFLDSSGSGQVSDAITCLDYVQQMKSNGYNIVATNNSWGGGEYSQALTDAIQAQQQAGILFVAAAGNGFGDNDVAPTYPANTLLPNVISVAATTNMDALAAFSNTGRHTVHMGAPGQQILSTWPGSNYAVLSGTSMATPHVAGAVALLAAQNPNLDWRALKNLVLAGGDSRSSLAQTVTGSRLNLNGSMSCSGKSAQSRLQPVNDVVAGTVGVPLTLEELNVNCSQPAGSVQVTVSPSGSIVTLVDDGSGADQASGDGIYTGQWTPSAIGSYTLTFPGGDVVPVEVLNDYVVAPTPYNYVSITGTNLNLGDDSVAQITSPFAIAFGGGSFTTLQIGSNGTISFTDAYSPVSNNVIPTLAPVPVTLIAPFWQDLYPVAGSPQNVYWAVMGSAPNRQLIVEWRNVRSFVCHSDSSATITFEVIFSESSSNILFEYADTTFGDYCYFQDAGAEATVGVQVSPSVGTMWTVNDPVIVSGSALLWTIGSNSPPNNPTPTITTVSPPTVPVGGPAFTLTVNGTGFVPTSAVNFDLYERPTTYVSSTKLTAEIPADAIGPEVAPSTYIWVQNPPPGGGQSNNVTYPLSNGVPTITSISPTSVTAGSFSFSLIINGTGFSQSAVYWNGTLLNQGGAGNPNQMWLDISYTMIENPGTVQITVVNAAPGGGTSNAATFTILSQAQAPLYLQQHPLLNGTGSPSNASPATPTRFLGWKYAARGGEDYLKAFSRPRAQSPLPSPSPALSAPIGNSIGPSSPSGTPSPAGLGLRALLPADFIPSGVAAGDFNGDGIPDWVVSNGGSNNLWVYLGRGDGTFSQATVIPLTGQSPVAVAAADLRGIGRLDIIVAEADSESIGVLLGNGDGTFAAERTYFVPGAPISLAVADMNHDGHLDVVAGVIPDFNVSLVGSLVTLLGDGTGGFAPPLFEPYLTFGVQTPESIAVADFEQNGKPDAVVVDPSVGAIVYVNDGTGLLKEAQPVDETQILAGVGPLTVAAGDVNEDGCPDAVTFDNLGIARVYLGNCDSTFQPQSTEVGEGDFGWASTLVDVNGDGHLDLVYSGISAQTGYGQVAGNLLAVHFGDGKGNFGPAHVYRGGQTSFALAVADFNRDGHPDVITANQDSDSATIFLNDGQGGFGMPSGEYIGYISDNNSSGPVNAPYTSYTPADVNGDGKPDLVVLEVGPGYPNPFQATVMLNDGTGHFGPAVHSPVAEGTSSVFDYLLGDFRNTGQLDLVTLASYEGSNSQLVFAPNAGAGSFGPPRITNIPQSGALAAGDFNHDGNLDLAVASSSPTGTITITIYLGHGDGTFTAQKPVSFNTNSPGHWVQGLWVGDFNGDGKLDLLAWLYVNVDPPQNNDVYELLGNGDGTFAPAKLVLQNLTSPAVADFNHDGLPDVVDNRDQFTDYPNFTVPQFRIFLCQPDGSFVLSNTYMPYTGQATFQPTLGTVNGARYPTYLGDFNGDGNMDLAAIQKATGYPTPVFYVQFLLGNGDGSFTPSYEPYLLYGSLPTTAFDVTGDGRADLIESDIYTSSFQVIPGSPGSALQVQMVSDPVIGSNGAIQISLATLASAGTQVSLTASDPAIEIPASVTIPAGSLTQDVNFTIKSSFNSTHVFWIQGTIGSSTATAYGTQATAQGQYGVAVYINNATESVFPGLTTSDYQLGITSLSGYSTTLSLSCQGLPAGASCQFGQSPLSVAPGGNATTSLVINTTSSTALGEYPFTIQGSDGTIVATVKATLDVGDYSVSITPSTLTALAGTTAVYTVNVTSIDNYSAYLTGTCSGIPAPAVCSFNGPIYPGGSTSLNVQTNTLAVGSYNFTVALSNGVATRSASAQLDVGDYSVSITPSTLTALAGTTAVYTVNVTSIGNSSASLTGTCSGIPAPAVCSFNGPISTGGSTVLNVQTNTLAVGSYNFTVTVSNGVATSSALAQLNVGDFNAALSTNSLSVAVGQSGNVTINVTGQNGFTDLVTLSCGGAPSGTSCAISPAAVNPSPNGTAATMIVTVNATPSPQNSRYSDTGRTVLSASISGLLLGCFVILTSAFRKGRGFVACLMLLAAIGLVVSCGGSSGGGGGGGGGTSFNLTVQASADGVIKNAGTVKVTVP